MASEDKLRHAAERGTRAKALLQNDLLQEAFATFDAELIKKFKETGAFDDKTREYLHILFYLNENYKTQLERIVSEGEFSMKALTRIKKESLLKKVMR